MHEQVRDAEGEDPKTTPGGWEKKGEPSELRMGICLNV